MLTKITTLLRKELLILTFLVLPTISYLLFVRGGLSRIPNDWSAFGGFLSPFVAVVSVIVFYKLTSTIASDNRKSIQASERPVLALKNIGTNASAWRIQNAGKGPAMNIRVGIGTIDRYKGAKFSEPSSMKMCNPVKGNSDWEEFPIDEYFDIVIIMIYQDIYDNEFISLQANGYNYTRESKNWTNIVFKASGIVKAPMKVGDIEITFDEQMKDKLYKLPVRP